MGPARIYLTGHLAIEYGSTVVNERHLAGRQGRVAFAYLLTHRAGPVSRDELLEVIWGNAPPPEVETAMSAILSRLCGAFKKAHLADAGIDLRMGAVSVRLPADTRIDLEEAANAIDTAEAAGARMTGDRPGPTRTLPWQSGGGRSWRTKRRHGFIAQRGQLRAHRSRRLQVLASVSVENGESELAVQYANEVVALDPFRETSYQQLMRLHARMGNRGEALRVFSRLRALLRDELGTSPSPQSDAVFREILTA